MAGGDVLHAASVAPKVLYSGQLGDTNEDVVYTAPAGGSAVLKNGSLCNVSGAAVNVSLSILRSGQTMGTGIHRVISTYPLPAGDTLALREYVRDHCLGAGDFVAVQASTGGAIDVVLSGIENT